MSVALESPAGPWAEPAPQAAAPASAPIEHHDILLIDYSGELEKLWAMLVIATSAAAMGARTKVFLTFWGLQASVKDSRRITGQAPMQRLLALLQRPGISHRSSPRWTSWAWGPGCWAGSPGSGRSPAPSAARDRPVDGR